MKISYEIVFKVGQLVYHATPESEPGVVVNYRHLGVGGLVHYLVAFNETQADWYSETELSANKVFI